MKILFVEDDPSLSRNVQEALTEEHYEVEVAYDGLLAENLMKTNEYACIILDVNLPYKSGFELCTQFRTYNTTTPVIFLTAFDDLDDKVKGYSFGADDYLTKPFYMKELLLRIHSLLKRSGHSELGEFEIPNDIITIGDLSVNTKNKTATRSNIEINLTPREYHILVKLMIANGDIVTKKEIIKDIWGASFDVNTNTIEVFINLIRNKIDKPFDKKLIKTKVGFGYYLDIH
jgi:two-component system OmpR family response regulator